MRVLRARYRTEEEFLRHYQPAFPSGGIFFPTRAILPIGEEVVVEVRFPQLVNRTMIRGRVAWCRSGQHRTKLRAGVGIEFDPSEVRRRDFLLAVAKGQGQKVVTRRHRRLPVTLPAEFRRPQERTPHKAVVEDIGPGGAFLRTEESLVAGSDLFIEVAPPGSVAAIQLAARVAWTGDGGFGVEFRARDAGGTRRLKELVRRIEELEEEAMTQLDSDSETDLPPPEGEPQF